MYMNSRKTISGLVLLVVGVTIAFIKGDVPTNLLNLMQLLYSAFVLGNVGEHAAKSYTKVHGPKEGE